MKKVWTLTVFLWMAGMAAAQPQGFAKADDEQAFRDGYHTMCRGTTSFQARFEQVKRVALLKNELKSKGTVAMRRDNKIKIAYTQPYRYVFVMDNAAITIKDGDAAANNVNMRNNKLFRQISAITLSGINGQLLDTKDFAVEVFESPQQYLVQAVPRTKEMKAFYTLFALVFDKDTFCVERITMTEVSGDVSTMVFSATEINKEIDDAVFVVH